MNTCVDSLALKVCVIHHYFVIQFHKVLYASLLIDMIEEVEKSK